MNIKTLFNKILGRPLASSQRSKQKLGILTGLAALGLDALASTAYGPEAALVMLLPLGPLGLHYFFPLILAILTVLFLLYLSYMQTMAAYPENAGVYIVASDNLGERAGLWAAIALLLDYLLNVAVGISAGVGVVVSALPSLQPYTLALCLLVLFMLTVINLRGVRESGTIFIIPVVVFVFCMGGIVFLGLVYAWHSGGHPASVVTPPPLPSATENVGLWIMLSALANGLTAMTGIEAISNSVSLFHKPAVTNARWTLTIIVGILGLLLLCIGYLCPAYHIGAMNQDQPGYQTVLSQLAAAVTGKGVFYYLSVTSIFIVLAHSAQTSFMGFPRICRILADDYYLPHFFAERGRRLVFSHGIILLAVSAGILLFTFDGITIKLIPLFAVGTFCAFLFSQAGMVVYWLRRKEPGTRLKLICNAAGAIITFIALIIMITVKFTQGAWIVLMLAPLLVILLTKINRHYSYISRELENPLKLKTEKFHMPIVVIPIQGWNRLSERAVQFGLLLSDNIICVYISTESDNKEHWLRKIWGEKIEKPAKKAKVTPPALEIIHSPYRRINTPLLNFIKKLRKNNKNRLITMVIPELIEPHWYEYLLHNLHAASLRTLLFLQRDHKTVVITIPWYLRDKPDSGDL